MYKCTSSQDQGTLYHIRNLINRRNVVNDPKSNIAACEEFFLLVVEAYILLAAMEVFEMSTLDSTPANTKLFPAESSQLDSNQCRSVLLLAVREIIEKFVSVSLPAHSTDGSLSVDNESYSTCHADHLMEYACEVLSTGLLLMEFIDGIREGDGYRILRCWRAFLPIFKATNRKNYSIEAFTFLVQHDFLFSPRLRQQLVWERTVNVHGMPGRNISCDLLMEHLNRVCKGAMGNLGSNIQSNDSVSRIGKSVGELMSYYDDINDIKSESKDRSKRSEAADLDKIIEELKNLEIFKPVPGRSHLNFPKFYSNPCKKLDLSQFKLWLNGKLKEVLRE